MTVSPPATSGAHPSRRQFLIMLVLFVLPVAGAYLLYFGLPGQRPGGTTNYGTLVTPARPLPMLDLRDSRGHVVAPFSQKWSLVYFGAGACAETCRKQIFLGRQVRTALGKDQGRLQRVFVATDGAALTAAQSVLAAADHPDLIWVVDAGAPGRRAADFFGAAQAPEALFLVDPLGNWMMTYPAHVQQMSDQFADFHGILKDLKHLLLLSNIG